MREDLKSFIKGLYLKGKIDANRFKKLNAVANDLKDADNKTEEYQMLFEYATGDYPEFKKFLTQNRLHAAEDLEAIFMSKIDELISQGEAEKAQLILGMMETINQEK